MHPPADRDSQSRASRGAGEVVPPLVRVVLLVAGLGVAALLVWHAGVAVVGQMLGGIGWTFFLVTGLYAVYVGTRAAALWRVIPASVLPYRDVLRIRISTEAVEMLTFTGPLLAEPAKGWLLIRRGLTTSAAFAAVITEYLLYMVASSCLATIALVLLLNRPELPEGLRTIAVLVLVVTGAFIAAFAFASFTGTGLIVPAFRAAHVLIGQRADALADRFQHIETGIVGFLHRRPRRLLEALMIETGAQALLVIEVWTLIAALGFPRSWIHALVIEGGVKFVGAAFAVIPGQFGAAEGTYSLMARGIGLPAAVGLSVVLARRVRSVLVAVVGLIALTFLRDR